MKKLTYEFVKDFIEKENYKLLSTEYIGSHIKLKTLCPKGHNYETSFSNFKNGTRCVICSYKDRSEKRKLSFQEVESYFESFGYKLLSTEYINANNKLKLKCPKGHVYKVTFGSFKNNNHRCPECAGNVKNTYEYVKEYIESFDYKLISTDYKNNKTKLKIQCDKGHTYKVRFDRFKNGVRCPKCFGTPRHKYEYIKEYFEKEGYKLISKEYKNNRTKLKTICPKGHNYIVDYHNFSAGDRCYECNLSNITSKGEKEVLKYVKSIYSGNIIENDRNTVKNPKTNHFLELDVYLPDINKAIEYNGTYWHSLPKKIKLDKIKLNECKKQQIDLLVITDIDWKTNKSICENNIKDFIK